MQFNSTETFDNKNISLSHQFPAPVFGTFGVWMYDTGADIDSSNYIQFAVTNSTLPNEGSVLGTYDYDLGPGNGGDVYYYIKDFGDNIPTIDRTTGWHHFEISISPTATVARIDGIEVFSENAGVPVDHVLLTMYGPSWRPAWTSYFDDFSYDEGGVQNPDTTPPTTTASLSGPLGSGGAYTGPVDVTLTATDPAPSSGIAGTFYRLDGGALQTYAGAFQVSAPGTHDLDFYSSDIAGNVEAVNHLPIIITSTPLTIVAATDPTTLWPPNGRTINVGVSGHVAGGSPATASFAVSDEYGRVQPSGSFAVNPDGTFAFTVPLEAFRNGTNKDGRTYTITLLINDQARNTVSQSLVVTVLHDQGNQAASVPVTTATGGGAPAIAPVPAADLISLLASDVATLPKGKGKK